MATNSNPNRNLSSNIFPENEKMKHFTVGVHLFDIKQFKGHKYLLFPLDNWTACDRIFPNLPTTLLEIAHDQDSWRNHTNWFGPSWAQHDTPVQLVLRWYCSPENWWFGFNSISNSPHCWIFEWFNVKFKILRWFNVWKK